MNGEGPFYPFERFCEKDFHLLLEYPIGEYIRTAIVIVIVVIVIVIVTIITLMIIVILIGYFYQLLI